MALDELRKRSATGGALTRVGSPKKKGRSIFGQITGMLTSAPMGLAKLGFDAVKDVTYNAPRMFVRVPLDMATGHGLRGLSELGDTVTLGMFTKGRGGYEHNLDVLPMLSGSIHQTGMNLRHPTRYFRAARDGEIVPMLVNDIGNLAIVGGAAAKGLGVAARGAEAAGLGARGANAAGLAGGLERTASILNRGAALGGKVADAPISVWRKGLSLGREGINEGLLRLSQSDSALAATAEGLRTRYPMLLTREGAGAGLINSLNLTPGERMQRLGIRRGVLDPAQRDATILKHRIAKGMNRAGHGLSAAEQEAAIALHLGEAGQVADAVRRSGTPGADATFKHAPLLAQPTLSAPAESITPTAFRQMSPDELLDTWLPNSNVAPGHRPGFHATNNPDLAIGQGGSVGVTVQFDTTGMRARINQKPGILDPATQGAELLFDRTTDSRMLRDSVRAIRLDPTAAMSAGTRAALKKLTRDLESQGWTRSRLNDGTIQWTHNSIAPTATPLTPDAVEALTTPERIPGHFTTAEGAQLAHDIVTGRADPDTTARVQRLVDELAANDKLDTGMGAAGIGMRNGRTLSQENIDRAPQPMMAAIAADDTLNQQFQAMTPAQQQAFLTTNQPLEPSLYPAVWRPLMVRARRVNELAGRRVMPESPWEMAQAGIKPGYLPQAKFDTAGTVAKIGGRIHPDSQALPGTTKLSDEFARSGEGYVPRTAGGVAGVLTRKVEARYRNEPYRQITENFTRRYGNTLDPATLAEIQIKARQVANEQIGAVANPQQAADIYDKAYLKSFNDQVLQAMDGQGLEPWIPEGKMGDNIGPFDVTSETPFVTKGLRDALYPWMEPIKNGPILAGLEKINSVWKRAILPLSVRWQIGDGLSNYMMAGLVGDIDPLTMSRRMREASKMADTPEGARLLDRVINDTGIHFDDANFMRNGKWDKPEPKPLGIKHPVRTVAAPVKWATNKSFAFNQAMNGIQRHAVFLEKLTREMEKAGLDTGSWWNRTTGMDVGRLAESSPVHDVHLNTMIENAVDQTNKILGDMANMSKFERKYMRQVFPFWTWTRHVASLTSRLAIDHPARLMFILRLGELAGTDGELPDFLQGSQPGPGGYWPTSFLNPLADVGGIPGAGYLMGEDDPAKSLLRGTSPVLKVAAASLLGQDWNRGGQPVSRTPGTGWVDDLGKPVATPLALSDPGGVLYQILKTTPQGRALLDLAPRGNILGVQTGDSVRYGTGAPIRGAGKRPIPTGNPAWRTALGAFGVPTPEPYDKVNDILDVVAKRRRKRKQAKASA